LELELEEGILINSPAIKARVLFVDDEPRVLTTMRMLFRAHYEVFFAEGGPQALELLKKQPVDVIVSDQRMPGMSGIELLATGRRMQPDMRRLLVSGFADFNSALDAINEVGVDRMLTKPWDIDELREVWGFIW